MEIDNKLKGLIEYEGKQYWIDMSDGGFPSVKTYENGKLRPTMTSEVDLIDLIQYGHVVSTEKPI